MIGQKRNVTKKMKRETVNKILVFCGLVVLGVATRWISDAFKPNLSNVTATVAAALFAGFYLTPRWTACSGAGRDRAHQQPVFAPIQ